MGSSPSSRTGSDSPRATVVGAGIVGICCALYLQREGFAVAVIDEQEPGEGCSKGNGGVLGEASCLPLAMPGIWKKLPDLARQKILVIRPRALPRLLPWLRRFLAASRRSRAEAIARALRSLQERLWEAYLPLLREARAESLIEHRGFLHVFEEERSFRAAELGRDIQRRNGIEMRELGPEEVHELAPALGKVSRGVYFPGVRHSIEPFRLVRALAAHFVERGGSFRRERVRAVAIDGQGRPRTVSNRGEAAADVLVIAAGTGSRALAAELGAKIPLWPERGYHVTFGRPEVQLRIPIKSEERKLVVTPMECGLRAVGVAELGAWDAPLDYRLAERLARQCSGFLPGLMIRDVTYWVGGRPSTPDSLPVIGRLPACPSVHLAFGHGHVGLGTAAVTGKLIAELATGRPTSVDVTPFRPDRFSGFARPGC